MLYASLLAKCSFLKEEVWGNVRGKIRELIFCPTRAVESSAEGAERLYGNTQMLVFKEEV